MCDMCVGVCEWVYFVDFQIEIGKNFSMPLQCHFSMMFRFVRFFSLPHSQSYLLFSLAKLCPIMFLLSTLYWIMKFTKNLMFKSLQLYQRDGNEEHHWTLNEMNEWIFVVEIKKECIDRSILITKLVSIERTTRMNNMYLCGEQWVVSEEWIQSANEWVSYSWYSTARITICNSLQMFFVSSSITHDLQVDCNEFMPSHWCLVAVFSPFARFYSTCWILYKFIITSIKINFALDIFQIIYQFIFSKQMPANVYVFNPKAGDALDAKAL